MSKKKNDKKRETPKTRRRSGGEAQQDAKSADQNSPSEMPAAPKPANNGLIVVGIGASAGGLNALTRLFKSLDPQLGMAFIVIQHLHPEKPSFMSELLSKQTSMPVREVVDGTQIEPNCVYTIPPNAYLSISDDVLHLSEPTEQRGLRMPVDFFLRSLAEDKDAKAVGIILSGSGTDGTLGIKAIKTRGGLSIVQDPNNAEHDGMPRSAMATKVIDHILPVEDIPAALARYARHPYARIEETTEEPSKDSMADLNSVIAFLRARTKYDFRGYRKKTILRRTARRMSLHHIESMKDYAKYLGEHPEEMNALVKEFLISVTDFFREPDAWKELERLVIAPLIRDKQVDSPIRVWVPGCATGEEAYSVAMLLIEQLQKDQKVGPLNVFATDIDTNALDYGRAGCYPANITADIPPERLKRFFIEKQQDQCYEVTKRLRESVLFAEQNLISDPPFSRLDLICCRNVLIYLEPDIQEKLISLFHFALKENGCLFLGNAETIGGKSDLFRPLSTKWRIYRRAGITRPRRIGLPIEPGFQRREVEPAKRVHPSRDARLIMLTQRRLLEWFAPVAVLVDQRYQIHYFCGATDDYLIQPPGIPSQDLLQRARDGLRSKLRGAVNAAITNNQTVTAKTRIKRGKQLLPCEITVLPITEPEQHDVLALVLFEDKDARRGQRRENEPIRDKAETSRGTAGEMNQEAVIRHLEQELSSTKEDLQNSIEQLEISNVELKAANEEAMSINEEFQSTNEELETSKEELQSLNEELNTVNAQLTTKIEELEIKNDDLSNLLTSTNLPAICLDEHLSIKWFTPAVTRLVPLVDSDVGRALSSFSHRFATSNLLDGAERVLKQLVPIERDIRSDDDLWFMQRIMPYRTGDNRIAGLVLTFTDVTHARKASQQLKQTNENLEAEIALDAASLLRLRDITAAANESETSEQAIRYAVQRLCEVDGWQLGHSYRRVEDGSGDFISTGIMTSLGTARSSPRVTPKARLDSEKSLVNDVIGSGKPRWIEDVRSNPEYVFASSSDHCISSAAAFPISVAQQVVAVIDLYSSKPLPRDSQYLEFMEDVGIQLGHVIERERLGKEIVELDEREQRQIGQELHDTIGQQLSVIDMILTRFNQKLAADDSPNRETAAKLLELVEQGKQQLQLVIRGLLPPEVEANGLVVALDHLAEQISATYAVECHFAAEAPVEVTDNFRAMQLYRIAQEAAHNAAKHAQAKHIWIRLQDGGQEVLTVENDGLGFQASAKAKTGQGLRIMHYRARLIGANLDVSPGSKGGTIVVCSTKSPSKE